MTRIDGASSVNVWLPHHAGYVVPEEMVSEVNVTTSAADAEQGFAGGSSITVVTKSGTNELHGSAFEFHDNQHLRARNFFLPANRVKPLSIYNNYGGTLGGPIKKDRLWFYGSARYLRAAAYVGGMASDTTAKDLTVFKFSPDSNQRVANDATWKDGQVRFTWQADQKNKFAVSWSQQTSFQPPASVRRSAWAACSSR